MRRATQGDSMRAYMREYRAQQRAAHMLFRIPVPTELGGGFTFDLNYGPPELRSVAAAYERILEGQRRYCRAHADAFRCYKAQHYQEHAEEIKARQQRWNDGHRDWISFRQRIYKKTRGAFSMRQDLATLYRTGTSSQSLLKHVRDI